MSNTTESMFKVSTIDIIKACDVAIKIVEDHRLKCYEEFVNDFLREHNKKPNMLMRWLQKIFPATQKKIIDRQDAEAMIAEMPFDFSQRWKLFGSSTLDKAKILKGASVVCAMPTADLTASDAQFVGYYINESKK